MSTDQETEPAFDPIVQPFIDFWSCYIKRANDNTGEFFEGINGNADVKTWQRKWYDTVSKSIDAYLRSPMFLQAMKHNTDLAIKLKRQADDIANEFARNVNMPTTGDISGLFQRLHSVEETILRRLAYIDERLTTIEQNIESHKSNQSS